MSANPAKWLRDNGPKFVRGIAPVQGAMGQSVKSFVMRALSNNQEKGEIALRNVSESEAAIIKEKTGIDDTFTAK